jgi:hypothetical protein
VSACVDAGKLVIAHPPPSTRAAPRSPRAGFSWRTVLSANLLHPSPRVDLAGLPAEHALALLTYGASLANLARAGAAAAGAYEHDGSLSEEERKRRDAQVQEAVALLCRASGVFAQVADAVLSQWEANAEPCGYVLMLVPIAWT